MPRRRGQLDQLPNLTISAVIWLELLQGFRSKAEMVAVRKSFEMRLGQAAQMPDQYIGIYQH